MSRPRTLTLRERRRAIIAKAVRHIELEGIHVRGARQEWAESRKRAGWTGSLVDEAASGGPLDSLRAKAREQVAVSDARTLRALLALSIIDAGRRLEVVLPHWPERE